VSDLLVNTLLATFLSIAVACFVLSFIGMVSSARAFAQADRTDAQPGFTPLDEWAATAALDPRDGTDLPAGDDGPCEASGWVLDFYAYLSKESSK
jgi:hypothetical protein